MSELIVHSIPGSPFGRAVVATLEEKGVPYRFVAVPPGSLKSEAHRSRHPFGRVPVLQHGSLMLYETQAILRYLDRIAPSPSLTPVDAGAAARMDQLLNVSDWYLFQGVNNVIGFQRIVGPRLLGLTPDETAIDDAMPKARIVFNELSRLLEENKFFVGEQLTLADLLIAPQLDFLAQTPEWKLLTADVPNLVSWLDRMADRASMRATTWERLTELAKAA